MVQAGVSVSTSAPSEEVREPVPARLPQAGRLDGLRAGGNRALGRALGGAAPARRLDRCAGPCSCGGHCSEDEELLAAGDRALSRAVLSREEARRAKPTPAGAAAAAPAPPPPAPKPPDPACGPDVTQTLKDAVAKTKADYASWDPAKRKKACIALENPECAGDAWDIVELHNRDWLDGYAPCADKTGPCKNTVMVDGSCSYGGSVNYVIFGHMCRLCDMWESTMENMIWAYKGYIPLVRDASANYKPSLEWARVGYKDWPAVASPAGDRPGCGTACPTAYAGAPFTLHWYPASHTENVSSGCEVWSSAYDQPPPPPEFGPPM